MSEAAASTDMTIKQIIERAEPMGNLGDLVIEDLTEDDDGVFFGILEDV